MIKKYSNSGKNHGATRKTKFVVVVLALFQSETAKALSITSPSVSSTPSIQDANNSLSRKTIHDYERVIMDVHASEVAGGRKAFAKLDDDNYDDTGDNCHGDSFVSSLSILGDENFIGRDIGIDNAGMDAKYLPKNGNMVFESLSPIVSDEECSLIVREARDTIAQGLIEEEAKDRSGNTQNSDDTDAVRDQRTNSISNSRLGEARLSNMPQTRAWLQKTLSTRFYPLLKDRFGVNDLVLYNGLVLGNQAPTRSQPIHRDASLLTLNVALSTPQRDYDGGGTYLEALDEILYIERGHLLCHAGSAMHAGNGISRGERWVLVLFLLDPKQPQLARRCHAKAIEHLQRGEHHQAEDVLALGLNSIAPHHDHLLYNTMGRLHLARGDAPSLALESFRLADTAYPICPNALVASATLLLEQKRPRAALRKLDDLLERIGTRDLNPTAQMSLKARAYGARRDAARCALMGADYLYNKSLGRRKEGVEMLSGLPPSWASWTLQHLPIAMDRLKRCLTAAPNEPSLLGMLDRAEFLLLQAQAIVERRTSSY